MEMLLPLIVLAVLLPLAHVAVRARRRRGAPDEAPVPAPRTRLSAEDTRYYDQLHTALTTYTELARPRR